MYVEQHNIKTNLLMVHMYMYVLFHIINFIGATFVNKLFIKYKNEMLKNAGTNLNFKLN